MPQFSERFDLFLGCSQTQVDDFVPTEKMLLKNLVDQVKLADDLGFGTAWIAESHLSIQAQKHLPNATLPHFNKEVGLNADTLQIAHVLFDRTKRIRIGSAIRSILGSGGPIVHAEGVRAFLALRQALGETDRVLELGFAAGRFDFANAAYGVKPRNSVEKSLWSFLRPALFRQATEIFLRLLRGETLSSQDLEPLKVSHPQAFELWQKLPMQIRQESQIQDLDQNLVFPHYWEFSSTRIVPTEVKLSPHLRLTLGSHDPEVQVFANRFLPCRVFNLSITPAEVIEATHHRMKDAFHPDGGQWQRSDLPRTVMAFVNEDPTLTLAGRRQKAEANCRKAIETYWKAMEGTISEEKVREATDNALYGTAEDVHEKIRDRFHPEDRLMLWFDFNMHNSQEVQASMRSFAERAHSL